MLAIVTAFRNIALLRIGPEDLPDSPVLLGLTMIVYVLIQVPVAWIVYQSVALVSQTVALDVAMLSGGLWLVLWLTGYRARFRQTLTALLGTSALLTLLALPFHIWQTVQDGAPPGPAFAYAAILAIVIWSLVIVGHILSRALSRPFAVGLMVALAYFFVHTTVLFEFVPVPE